MVERIMDCWNEPGVTPRERVGAMVWGRHEYPEYDTEHRPYPHLQVMTPAGLVCLDCPETDPPYLYWQRSGEPPNVTASPSLNVNEGSPGAWHGWLQNGVLTP
jgi:hypothetical protein